MEKHAIRGLLSSDTPPTTMLLIFNPGSWFPICTVSCEEEGPHPPFWKHLLAEASMLKTQTQLL